MNENAQVARPKVGLALGSGALRGFAHIGALKALEENGIPIDCIAGTSIGAIVGAIYACGTDLHMLEGIVSQLDEKMLFDYTVPRRGFMKGVRAQQLVQTLTGNRDFSQTRIPFVAVACDICAGEPVYLREGKLHDAVRASMSVPGMYEPVTREGKLLVDGGVVERVPAPAVRLLGADVVIGVDVGAHGEPVEVDDLLGIFLRSIELMEWQAIKHRIDEGCDVLVLPDVHEKNPWTMAGSEGAIRSGYEACLARMDDIRRAIDEAGKRMGA